MFVCGESSKKLTVKPKSLSGETIPMVFSKLHLFLWECLQNLLQQRFILEAVMLSRILRKPIAFSVM